MAAAIYLTLQREECYSAHDSTKDVAKTKNENET
jgi:hypothetical protein